MKTIVLRHRVGDFNTWIRAHQGRVEAFSSSVSSFRTFQDADDPNSVLLILEVKDMDKFNAMFSDPMIAEAKKQHTVIDPILMSNEVMV